MLTVAIAGASGSGKTYALRNLDPKEMVIISPYKKIVDLPFKGAMKNFTKLSSKDKTGNFVVTNDILHLPGIIKHINDDRPEIKFIVIEDITHFQNARTTSDSFRARKHGGEAFARFDDFAADMKKGLVYENNEFRDDLTIIHHYHIDEDAELGEKKLKTAGKMLERSIDLPSYYTYLVYTYVKPYDENIPRTEQFKFTVSNDGIRPAKTGLVFEDQMYVPNDTKLLVENIRNYIYGE